MLYGTVPFKANNMSELHQLIMKAKYSLKDDKVEISEDAKSLIRALLEPDPTKRLNIE
jgi:serine/threonine protein kinase